MNNTFFNNSNVEMLYDIVNNEVRQETLYDLDKDINNPYTWQDLTMGRRGSDSKAQWKYPTHKPIRSKLIKKYKFLQIPNKKTLIHNLEVLLNKKDCSYLHGKQMPVLQN